MSTHQISVKAILTHESRVLLRKNERSEWELLGGRIEEATDTLEWRLTQELQEESGVGIAITQKAEPWFYNIGGARTVIIAPFRCIVNSLPQSLIDEDGGTVEWHDLAFIEQQKMPFGYLDSIRGIPPRNSYSEIPETRENEQKLKPKTIKPWRPFQEFAIEVSVRSSTQADLQSCRQITSVDSPRSVAMQLAGRMCASNHYGVTFSSFQTIGTIFTIEYNLYVC